MKWLSRLFEPKLTESARFDRLEESIRALADTQREQGRTIKNIELEWEQVYDKVTHLMARITKRQAALDRDRQALTAQEAAGEENGDRQTPEPIAATGVHGRLQEMRRRHGLLQG